MAAAIAFIIVVIISAISGFTLYNIRKHIVYSSNHRSFIGTIAAAIIFWFFGKFVFLAYGFYYTPAGDPDNYSGDYIELRFRNEQMVQHYLIKYQTRTEVGRDYELYLKVGGVTQGTYRFEIQGPKSLEFRTAKRCDIATAPSSSSLSCTRTSGDLAEVSWETTPTSTGTAITSILIPNELRPSFLLGNEWIGGVFRGNQQLVIFCRNGFWFDWVDAERASTAPTSSYDNCDDRLGERTGPVKITPKNPRMQYGKFLFDESNGKITFSTEVVKTLGVTENTYAMLAIVGAVLASGLGSGWLIQGGAWVFRRFRNAQHAAKAD